MQVVPMLLTRMRDHLTDRMIHNVMDSDPTKADVVKIGRFQDDPTVNNIYLAISGGDPEDPEYTDGIVTLEEMERIGLYFPAREVGGGVLWWRRFVVQVGCYFVTEQFDEESAMDTAYNVMGKAVEHIETMTVSDIVDDYGETAAYIPTVTGTTFIQGGGPPSSYLWRGKIRWQVLTERP